MYVGRGFADTSFAHFQNTFRDTYFGLSCDAHFLNTFRGTNFGLSCEDSDTYMLT